MDKKTLRALTGDFALTEAPRLQKLRDYYLGRHAILERSADPGKPNNRLVCNFCRAITDATVGYFMGTPIAFDCADARLLSLVNDANAYNDEQFAETALARDLSVYGRAAELCWIDEDAQLRFSPIDPLACIPIWGDGPDRPLVACVRICSRKPSGADGDGSAVNALTGAAQAGAPAKLLSAAAEPGSGEKTALALEVWSEDAVEVYDYDVADGTLTLVSATPHPFGQCPVNFYRNNADCTGDFEPVLTLVDAYEKLQSASVDDFELFADSYLAITGMSGTTPEDIEAVRRDRVLLLDNGGDAKWLTKPQNDEYIENLKSRISRDIYRFSGTVDLSEEVLHGGVLSGAAIRYRLISFENRVSVTERYFKKGLQRRYELLCAVWNALGGSFDYRDIRITFSRNVPAAG